MQKTNIPIGPLHPALFEPLKIELAMDNEKIIDVSYHTGYQYRQVEKKLETNDFDTNIFYIERLCGMCSFFNTLAYCRGIENIMNIEVPDRAKFIRVIISEVCRIQKHMFTLALVANSIGFENLYMQIIKKREKILDIIEEISGNRMIVPININGGIRINPDRIELLHLCVVADEVYEDVKEIEKVFVSDKIVKERLCGIGVLSADTAREIGVAGPSARASGIIYDIRETGYSAYDKIEFKPVLYDDGDAFARTFVRINEIYESVEIIRQMVEIIPKGETFVHTDGLPDGETLSRVEQPEGETAFFIKGDGSTTLNRVNLISPSLTNLIAFISSAKGLKLEDIPPVLASFGICISCLDK